MIDVVMDLSGIYGSPEGAPQDAIAAYDENSNAVMKLKVRLKKQNHKCF
jgi:hypothetical protein